MSPIREISVRKVIELFAEGAASLNRSSPSVIQLSISDPLGRCSALSSVVVAATAATAVTVAVAAGTASASEKKEYYDKNPNIIVVEKFANAAVHTIYLEFDIIMRICRPQYHFMSINKC